MVGWSKDVGLFGIDLELNMGQCHYRLVIGRLGAVLIRAQNHPIIGKAHQAEAGSGDRQIKRVQVNIGQQRRERAALQDADGGRRYLPVGKVRRQAARV